MIAASLPDKKSARKPAAAKTKAKPQPRAAKRAREKPEVFRKSGAEPEWESVPYRFTVEQYHALAGNAVLSPEERVELIHGQIFPMPPIGPRHSAHTSSFIDTICPKCPRTLAVRLGEPVFLPPDSVPQPDLAVVKRRKDFYVSALPRPEDIRLLIEVADTTVNFDIGVKAKLYAQAGIPEYWVLDLPARRVRVFREPAADGYAVEEALARGKTVRCSTVPELVFEVGELLL